MKKLKLTKVIASTLIVASVLALNPVGARAEWKQDSQNWRYVEGNSWAIGWRNISGNWYYFDQNGYMLKNTQIQGWKLDDNGIGSKSEETDNKVTVNSVGNSNSNISNLGLATIQGEYIYYVNLNNNVASINRIKVDGTGKELLSKKIIKDYHLSCEGYANLNVIGEWIYYSEFDDDNNIYLINKMKTDGTSKTTLISYPQDGPKLNNLNVVGDWIYYTYSNGNPNGSVLCKMKIDGSSNKILKYNYDFQYSLNIINNYIYYRTESNDLYRIDTNGSNLEKVNSESSDNCEPVIDGDSLYYMNYVNINDSNNLFSLNKLNLETGYVKKVITDNVNEFSWEYINVKDSWIYYTEAKYNHTINDWEYSICKIKIDGSYKKQLISNYVSDYSDINVVGDWIYYRSNFKTYKMKIDGSCKTIV